MNIILCGLMFSPNGLKDTYQYSKSGVQMAPHNFQSNLVRGLQQAAGEARISIVNVAPIGSFPLHDKRMLLHREVWNEHNVQIGYLNLPFFKQHQQKHVLIREIEKKLDHTNPENNCLIVYHTYLPFLEVVKHFKQKYPGIHTALIATDCVPGRGDMEKYMTRSAVRRGNKVVALSQWCDGFVLLTKYLAEALEIGEKPYVITECIANESQPCCKASEASKNRCLYTGSIDREFGICELAQAFSKLENAELWICGGGTGKEYIEELAATSASIKYFGFVEQAKLQEYRDQCDFLINPRRPTGTYTKYSFPSKTAEYMMSGKPVIMYKLEGIPDAYDAYLNYLKTDTPDQIKEELGAIFAMDYATLKQRAALGREYMLEHTSSKAQAKKIIGLFREMAHDINEAEQNKA